VTVISTVYERYAALRDAKGVTDYRVAKDAGVENAMLSNWKAGRYEPKPKTLLPIASYFGVSLDYFYNEGE